MSIVKRLVLVLGAGASHEYGLPLGLGLANEVKNSLNFTFDFGRIQTGNPSIFESLRRKFSNDGDNTRLNRYLTAGRGLSAIIEHYASIDEAIHLFSGQDEAIEIGKLAIASRIIQAEKASSLRIDGERERAKVLGIGGWMPRLFSMIVGSLTKQQLQSAFENIAVINFNYDRSLDHYLYSAIQSLGVSPEAAKDILATVRTYRPYGSLGPLPWQDRQGIPFGEVGADLWKMSDGIRTFTEQNHSESVMNGMRKDLAQSNVVIFLGFGFHKQNLDMLSLSDAADISQCFVTACGVDEHNENAIKNRLSRVLLINGARIDIAYIECAKLFVQRAQKIGMSLS